MNTKHLDFHARAVLGAIVPLMATGVPVSKELALQCIQLLADQITLDDFLVVLQRDQATLLAKLVTEGRA